MSTRCYIGLGSNQAQPVAQLNSAIQAMAKLADGELVRVSSFYRSKPMGPQDQDDYVNAVAELIWHSDAISLLDELQKIEQEQGRVRKAERWGPRTLDLDILLFGDKTISEPRLTVPHYGMQVREFVLYPLYEISGDIKLPQGPWLNELRQQVPQNGLEKLT